MDYKKGVLISFIKEVFFIIPQSLILDTVKSGLMIIIEKVIENVLH